MFTNDLAPSEVGHSRPQAGELAFGVNYGRRAITARRLGITREGLYN